MQQITMAPGHNHAGMTRHGICRIATYGNAGNLALFTAVSTAADRGEAV
jgi:hypothetical protein